MRTEKGDVMRNTYFSFLPGCAVYRRKDYISEIIKSEEKLDKSDLKYPYQRQILYLLVKKLTSEDDLKPEWTKNDFVIFKTVVMQRNDKDMKYIKESILKSFGLTNIEILDQLHILAQHVEWYPELTRSVKPGSKIYQTKEKPIIRSDCYRTISEMYRHMLLNISTTAGYIFATYVNNRTNYEELVTLIQDEDIRTLCLTNFDKSFDFVQGMSLYNDIYQTIKEEYFSLLLNFLVNINNKYIDKIENKKRFIKNRSGNPYHS